MFEERAVILGKLGKHEQVLSIYVMMLGDVNRAIHYCNEVYSTQKEGSDEVSPLCNEPKVLQFNQPVFPVSNFISLHNDDDSWFQVYVLLIKMLISPPDSWLRGVPVSPATSKPDLETALSLLEEHAAKIQPIQVSVFTYCYVMVFPCCCFTNMQLFLFTFKQALEVLPDTVPICRIRHFLEKSLQKQLNERRHILVLKGLTLAENLQVSLR